MKTQVYINETEIKFLNELFFRIDQGGGMVWIGELLNERRETYQKLSEKVDSNIVNSRQKTSSL